VKSVALSRCRWTLIAFAFLATAINYLDRQSLSVAAPLLRIQFHMSDIGYSRILFAFMLAYTVMNGLSGIVIDRLGTKLGYAVFVGWWSFSSFLQIFAENTLSLGIFRFFLGLGEAGNWPAAAKLVAEWFPPEERSFASGLFNSGSAAGAILAPPLIALLVLRYSWRAAFAFVSCLGFAWLAGWLFLAPSAQYSPPYSAARSPTDLSLRSLLRSRFTVTFTLSKIFIDPVWYFYTFWFPEYLVNGRHKSLAYVGHYAWIPFLVAGAGSAAGGLLSQGLLHLHFSVTWARKAAVTIACAMMATAVLAVRAHSLAFCIGYVSIAMAGYTVAVANMLPMPADVFPSNSVASVYGLASMGSGFGGMVFMLITGWVVQRYSYNLAFLLFAVLPFLGIGIQWLFMGPLNQAPALTQEELPTAL
jgi:MFS transporter, ACS family, aldohexuronate transporter